MNKPRILVVEDEAIVAMDIENRLDLLGYEVAGIVATGEAAIAQSAKLQPDLVLMDIWLKGPIDGIAAAVRIRECGHQPVIFLTAYAEDSTIQRAKLAEPYGYILKPFEDRELKTAIEMALYKHQAEQEILRLNRLYAVLSQVNQAIVRIHSREELFHSICRIAVEQGGFKSAYLGWLDPGKHVLRTEAQWGDPQDLASLLMIAAPGQSQPWGPADLAMQDGRVCLSNSPETDTRLAPWRQAATALGIQAVAAAPIRFQGQPCGAFVVQATELNFFQTKEITLLEEVALDISFALDNMERDAQRRQAEESARMAAQEWLTTFDAISDAVALIDLEGKILRANRAMMALLGPTDRNLLGSHCFELVHGASESAADCPLRRLKKSRHRESMILQRGDRWYEVVVDPRLDEANQLIGAVHIMADITERKQAEREHARLEEQFLQSQKMEAVGRLAGGIAHDFNNMLQAILGNVALALEAAPPDKRLRESLEEIEKSAWRSAELTHQLLAFARKQTISPKVLDLNDKIAGTLKMLQRLMGENIHLLWCPGAGLWPIEMDPSQLDQILANLTVNARDAMAGVGKLTIQTSNLNLDETYARLHPECVPGDYVMLAVSDTGAGIDEHVRAHLFEPFFTTKEVGKGTGLGLATVFGIVKQNRGLIEVYSERGQGAVFKLYFPRAAVEPEPQKAPALERHWRGTETVLLVEDEAQVLNLGQRILQHFGYTMLTARTPEKALELASQHPSSIHLLITDVVLPGMNGKELRDRLRTYHPRLKCLFMSGYTANVIAHHGVLDEGVEFLQKPFSIQSLSEKVRHILENSGTTQLHPHDQSPTPPDTTRGCSKDS